MNTSKDFCEEVKRIAFEFTWNHKPANIKKTTLIKQKTAGGLDMKDFTLFDTALKLNWVKRLCSNSDAPWQYITKLLLAGVGGTERFKCNYGYNLFDLDNHLPSFYKLIIFYWHTFATDIPKSKMRFSHSQSGITDF